MKLPTLFLLLLFGGLAMSNVAADDGPFIVPGFSDDEQRVAVSIGVDGPTKADVGVEVVLRLTGTPSLDLSKPLIEQIGWLVGPEDRMYCYWLAPNQAKRPLVVRAELVFGTSGAMLQPLVRVNSIVPGEHYLIVDWNFGQDQLVVHTLTVEDKEGPDPPPPPPPPWKKTVVIVEEADDRMQGLQGAKLNGHIEQVRAYLKNLPSQKFLLLDDDQPAATPHVAVLESAGITTRPAMLVYPEGRAVLCRAFGADAEATIEILKLLGVK